jgi:taurine dioxygenase
MTVAESRPLLDFLYAHSVQPDTMYRHMWKPGDLLMWDNRCTMHYAVHDYGTQTRNMHRVTVKGTKPV